AGQQVFGKLRLCIDGLVHHLDDLPLQVFVPQLRLLTAHDVHHFECEFEMAALVAEDPVGATGETVQQSLGAKEIHISENREDEQAFDAGCEADEIEQKLPPLLLCL